MPTQGEKDAARKRLLKLIGELVKIPTLGHAILVDVKLPGTIAPHDVKMPDSFPVSLMNFPNQPWFWVHVTSKNGLKWYFLPAKSIQKVKSGPSRNPPPVPDIDDLD